MKYGIEALKNRLLQFMSKIVEAQEGEFEVAAG